MIPFEREFQTFHSVQNYFLLNELLAPGIPMPLVDRDDAADRPGRLRRALLRAALLLRPGGHPPGAARRSGQGPLGRGGIGRTMHPFRYERPTTLADAIGLLAEHGPDARLLAGGTDLLIRLRDGSLRPRVVVDLKAITELDGEIRDDGDHLTIGAWTTMTDIAADERIRRDYEGLAEAAAVVGSVQIRNRATLAGNIANASPAADTAPALLVYDATVVVAGPAGLRRIPIGDCFVRSGVTTLERGELVTAIELPRPARHGSVHVRRTRRRGHDLASVTLACAVFDDGLTRLAYGSVGPRPIRCADDRDVLSDPAVPDRDKMERLEALFVDASPSPRSMRASPEYRLAMLHLLGLRAVGTAMGRLASQGVTS